MIRAASLWLFDLTVTVMTPSSRFLLTRTILLHSSRRFFLSKGSISALILAGADDRIDEAFAMDRLTKQVAQILGRFELRIEVHAPGIGLNDQEVSRILVAFLEKHKTRKAEGSA